MSDLVIRTLGMPSIALDGQPITVDTRKAVALFIYLAVESQPHSRDAIATLLWPEYDQSRARAALRRTLSVLHKALNDQYLLIERERIALAGADTLWVDALEFRRLLASRRAHGHTDKEVCIDCLQPLAAAVALYTEDFLSGFSLRDETMFEEWQLAQRQSLRDELELALAALTRCYILVGELNDAIGAARRWLAVDPLNESAHRFLMRLYGWTGQRTAVMRQYNECVETLERELGAPPLEITTRLYEAIRANRAPGPPDPAAPGPAAPHAAAVAAPPRTREVATPPSSTQPSVATPLIGRQDEYNALLSAFNSSARSGRFVVIEGEAGIGKTRLADELIAEARSRGSVVGVARCYEGEDTLAYAAMAALLRSLVGGEPAARLRDLPDIWLGEALRLAPEFASVRPGLAPPGPLGTPGAQSRFFEGMRETLLAVCATGAAPCLIVLDDAQWADMASLDALAYLARRIEHQPVCILLTWRSDTVDARHLLRRLLAEAQRRGRATHLTLTRLDRLAVREWVRQGLASADQRSASSLAERLYQETEGLPFFISEYVMALASGQYAPDGATWSAPAGVYDLLRSRLRSLSETGWQSLTSAAALGRSFDFDTVREVSGRSDEETAQALDELTAHGLIAEAPDSQQSDITYDFTHNKLRTLVYDETSQARRRLLHRRAAEALVNMSRRTGQGVERAAQIAQHYAAAGDAIAAARQHRIAGARSRDLYAHTDAIRHFERALELGYPNTHELRTAIADAYTLLGDYPAALTNYTSALSSASGVESARIRHKIGVTYARRGEWEEAERQFEQAMAQLDMSPETNDGGALGEQAQILADWSLAARRLEQFDRARTLVERSLALATAANDLHALAQAHNILGALSNSQGDSDDAQRHLEESLALAERLDDATLRAAALNNLALALQATGQLERALPLAAAALALCVTQGDRHHEAALHNNVADLLHSLGHVEDAMAHLKQAVSIYADIGVEAGALQTGIWKMVDW